MHAGVRFRWLDTGAYRTNDRQRLRSMVSFTARSIVAGLSIGRRPDIVIASSPHLLTGLSGVILARRFRVPLVFEVRDLWPSVLVDLGAIRAGSRVHRVLERLERACYGWADRILMVPPHGDRRVAEVGVDAAKCVHIPNATTFRFDATPGTEVGDDVLPPSLAEIFERCGGRDVLLYAGAQGVSNGLDLVLDAMDLLRSRDPATYACTAVVLVGDGGQHDELVAKASVRGHDQIHFHPPIDKPAVPAALARASFLLVSFADAPTYDYGLSPNKLFDYMAAARPVLLASRLADTPVDEATAGRRYDPGSAESLAEGIRALIGTSPDERRSMGERGRRLVQERYTIEATGDQLDELLRDMAPARR